MSSIPRIDQWEPKPAEIVFSTDGGALYYRNTSGRVLNILSADKIHRRRKFLFSDSNVHPNFNKNEGVPFDASWFTKHIYITDIVHYLNYIHKFFNTGDFINFLYGVVYSNQKSSLSRQQYQGLVLYIKEVLYSDKALIQLSYMADINHTYDPTDNIFKEGEELDLLTASFTLRILIPALSGLYNSFIKSPNSMAFVYQYFIRIAVHDSTLRKIKDMVLERVDKNFGSIMRIYQLDQKEIADLTFNYTMESLPYIQPNTNLTEVFDSIINRNIHYHGRSG